jgi:MFS family permease
MTALAPAPTSSDSRRRAIVLGICCLSVFITGVDLTIVNVALPSIGRDLGASVSGLQWAIDAYTLVIACLLMLSGSLADRFGRRRVFQIGLVTFSAGSLLCSVSGSLGELVAFRGLQAVGGAMLNPVAMAIIAAGAGLVGAPITNTALAGMPRDQAGVAGAIASTCRQAGSAIGVAVTGAILAGSSAGLVHESRPAWAVLTGCGIATLVLGLASTGRWAQASARRNGERLAAEAAATR